jgi:DNA polymerase delta subunit 2
MEDGTFEVSGFCVPGLPEQETQFIPRANKHQYVLLTSGFTMGDSTDPLRISMLTEYVLGQLGGGGDRALEAEIVRVVVAGGSIKEIKSTRNEVKKASIKKSLNKLAQPVKMLDYALAELATAVPVDVMPGVSDPCNVTMPQQPLHRCLFPHSERFPNTFNRVSNPYECLLDDKLTMLATSGQPVHDMLKYTRNLSAVDLMEASLSWRHIAPTAPDTLPCYPMTGQDPFVLSKLPHLYCSGGQSAFDTRLVRRDGKMCRIVAVPNFAETGLVVLVNLGSKNLSCSTIRFEGLQEQPANSGNNALAPDSTADSQGPKDMETT